MSDRVSRILVVEDEKHLAEGIRENLEAEGHAVEVVYDGESGLERARRGELDLIVLDVMLPGTDGFTMCETLRDEGHRVPVLFLTARSTPEDRVRGLEAGGDDYLAKPFHLPELLLRVAAILRRRQWFDAHQPGASELRFGGNVVDLGASRGRAWDGREHALVDKEAMILQVLSERPGEVVSRDEILERVWGYEVFPSTRAVERLVTRLRGRFEPEPDQPRHLHEVRGVGYRLTLEPEEEPS